MVTGGGAPAAISALTSSAKRKTRWTIMVFMAAETVEGFAPLDDEAEKDLAELMKVQGVPGFRDFVDVFVQLHRDTGARRIHIGHSDEPIQNVDLKRAKGQPLTEFVRWARGQAPPGPGGGSMLVLWGHSYRFAVGQTLVADGAVDALDFKELADVLQSLRLDDEKVFDIVGFDACDLASVEVAVQLQPFADYLLASEMGIPLPGWPYDRVLERLADPLGDRIMGAAELGSYAVRRYCEKYHADDRAVSLTLLDLNRSWEVAARVEILARKLALAVARSGHEKVAILELFFRSQTDSNKPLVDVADLCLNLMRECDDEQVKRAAEGVGDLLITPDPVFPGGSATGIGRPFVQEHGRNAARTAKLNGVSLYAPHVAGPHDFEAAQKAYDLFTFAKASVWNRLVHNMARSI